MAGRTRSKTYDVLAVSSTVHKANADYLAGILRYASGRPDWNLWLFNPMADISYGNVLPTRRASGVIVNGLDEVPLETLRPRNRRACVLISDGDTISEDSSVLCDNAAKTFLANTDKRIGDIAAETGFFDHAHMIRTFRRLTGLTPAKYRRRLLTPARCGD